MSLNKADAIREARAYKAYAAAKPANATPSRTLTNASSTGTYTGNRMGTSRPVANNQHLSLPMGAQIVRVM